MSSLDEKVAAGFGGFDAAWVTKIDISNTPQNLLTKKNKISPMLLTSYYINIHLYYCYNILFLKQPL